MSQTTLPANKSPEFLGIQNLLAKSLTQIKSALPAHLTPERMCRLALQIVQRTPLLLKCTPQSVVGAIVEASGLGLEIDMRGLAYLVPYEDRKKGCWVAQLIPGYKGLMDLAYRSGRVLNVYAETVHENDEFAFELGLSPTLRHVPCLDDRGKMRAVYAVAKLTDADPVFVVMGASEIAKVRSASKGSSSQYSPWQMWPEEMAKKTAIRRLCKYLPLSPEIQKAIVLDEVAERPDGDQHLGADYGIIEAEAVAEEQKNRTAALNAALQRNGDVQTAAPVRERQEEPKPRSRAPRTETRQPAPAPQSVPAAPVPEPAATPVKEQKPAPKPTEPDVHVAWEDFVETNDVSDVAPTVLRRYRERNLGCTMEVAKSYMMRFPDAFFSMVDDVLREQAVPAPAAAPAAEEPAADVRTQSAPLMTAAEEVDYGAYAKRAGMPLPEFTQAFHAYCDDLEMSAKSALSALFAVPLQARGILERYLPAS